MKFHKVDSSIVYPLSPKGLNTCYIESFTSYLIRLSTEHNIHIGTFINKLLVPRLGKEYLSNSSINGGNRFYDGAKSLNGFDKNANDFSQLINNLTSRDDIRELTLLKLKDIINPRNLLRNNLCWCSKCLEDWGDQFFYYPLLWFFKDVKVCGKHYIYLQDKCPSCNKLIPVLNRNSKIGLCPYCCKSLVCNYSVGGAVKKEEFHHLKNIEELIIVSTNSQLILKNQLVSNLLELVHYHTKGNQARFAKEIGIPKVTLWDWINGNRKPTLNTLLNILDILDLSLIELLFGEGITKKNSIQKRINMEQKEKYYVEEN